MQGLGFARNSVSSEGLAFFAEALIRAPDMTEGGARPCWPLRRLDLRSNEFGARLLLLLKQAVEVGGGVIISARIKLHWFFWPI